MHGRKITTVKCSTIGFFFSYFSKAPRVLRTQTCVVVFVGCNKLVPASLGIVYFSKTRSEKSSAKCGTRSAHTTLIAVRYFKTFRTVTSIPAERSLRSSVRYISRFLGEPFLFKSFYATMGGRFRSGRVVRNGRSRNWIRVNPVSRPRPCTDVEPLKNEARVSFDERNYAIFLARRLVIP